jgi:hypothetical protein
LSKDAQHSKPWCGQSKINPQAGGRAVSAP